MKVLKKSVEKNGFKTKIKIFKFFSNEFPLYSLFLLISLFFIGFLDAIGILGLLPVIEIILSESETSLIGKYIKNFLVELGFGSNLKSILIFIALIFIVKAALQTIVMYKVSHITSLVAHNFRAYFFKNIFNTIWTFFINRSTGRFINSVLIEAPKAATCIISICRVIESLIRIMVLIIAASITNLQVTIFAIFAGITLFIAMKKFLTISSVTSENTVKIHNKLGINLTEILENIKVIKVMNIQKSFFSLLNNQSHKLYKAFAHQTFSKNCISILREPIIVIFILSGFFYLTQNDKVSISEVIIVAAIFYRIVNYWGIWQSNLQTLIVNENYFWSFMELLNSATKQVENISGKNNFVFSNTINFKNVDFSYDTNKILSKFNCSIKAKKLNVFFGPSGVGKTSIIDLLCRLHEPQSGKITIDNTDLKDINLTSLRNAIGYVGQENFLFNDTLRNNLLVGNENTDDRELWAILKFVKADEFVKKLEKKLDTVVGERGLKISGGQRQRIFIARALLRKPEILILDEATVGLEENIEEIICKNLKSICSHTTIIAITHQKALLRHADNLFKMKKHIYGA